MILQVNNPKINVYEVPGQDDVISLSFELKDPMNPIAKPIKRSVLKNQNESYVEAWEEVLPEERGGTWEPEGDEEWSIKLVPNILRYINNAQFEVIDLGGPHFMKYSSDLGDHAAGDIVKDKNGNVKIWNSITVVTVPSYEMEVIIDENTGMPKFTADGMPMQKIVRDENGRPIKTGYVPGWSPEDALQSVSNLYIPLSKLTDTEGEVEEDEDLDEEDNDVDEEPPTPTVRRKKK